MFKEIKKTIPIQNKCRNQQTRGDIKYKKSIYINELKIICFKDIHYIHKLLE